MQIPFREAERATFLPLHCPRDAVGHLPLHRHPRNLSCQVVPGVSMVLVAHNPCPLGALDDAATVGVRLCTPTASGSRCPRPCGALSPTCVALALNPAQLSGTSPPADVRRTEGAK